MKLLIITKRENDISRLLCSVQESTALSPEEAKSADIDRFDSIAILGGTEEAPLMLSPYLREKLEACAAKGTKIFLEYVPSFGCVYSAQPMQITSHRLVCCEDITDELKQGDLLDSRYNQYIRPHFLLPDTEPLMYYHQYTPAHDRIKKAKEELVSDNIALFRCNNILTAAFRMCNYAAASFAPKKRWDSLVSYICNFLGGEPAAEYPESADSVKGVCGDDFFGELDNCTEKAIKLLKNYLVTPDGKNGIREGLSHNIRPDGGRMGANVVRTDCTGEAAGAFMFSFDEELTEIAHNMYSLCYGPLTVHGGEYDGMVRWSEEAWNVCYQDDVARAIIPSLLYSYFGISDKYINNAHNALTFLCQTTPKDGLRPARTDVLEFLRDKKEVRALAQQERGYASAHYNAYYSAALLLGYLQTGDESLKDTGIKGLETLMSLYPDTVREHSETSELCRLIFPLAVLCRVTGDEKHREMLERVFDDLQTHRHPSGGYAEWDTGYKAACFNNAGGECSLLAENGDAVADLLYSLNWLPLGFAFAWHVTGDEKYKNAWQDICQFFIKTQLISNNALTDGAWCRGIDLDRLECFGIPHDVGWGPCCVETGWTVAEIAMGMLIGKCLAKGELKIP